MVLSRLSVVVELSDFSVRIKRGAIITMQKSNATMVFISPNTSFAKPVSMTLLKIDVFSNNTTETIIRFVTSCRLAALSLPKPKWRTKIPFGRRIAKTKLKNHQ